MARWPWHRTRFYVEWLGEVAQAEQAAEEEAARAQVRQLIPDGAVTVDGLAGLGARVRKV